MISRVISPTRAPSAAAIVLTMVLAGCAAVSQPALTKEDAVRQRAQARADALIKGDLDTAYGYLTPGRRAVLTNAQWRATLPKATTWKAARVHSVECPAEDRCSVRLEVEHEPVAFGRPFGRITTAVDETWLLDGGRWWLFQAP